MNEDLKGRKVVVLGAGLSGLAAAAFALGRGAQVTLADDAPLEKMSPGALKLSEEGVALVTGSIAAAGTDFDLAILSPGVSINDPRVKALEASGCGITGEIELASTYLTAPIVAVTGTNGKTTVTDLLGEMFRAAGKKVYVGGNIGSPLLNAVGGDFDVIVAEISSFQLETCKTFRPRIAIWLNLTGDHLDRHTDMEGYAKTKARIFANQTREDAAIVNREDEYGWTNARKYAGTILPFSVKRFMGVGAWLEGDELVVLMPGNDGQRLPAKPMALQGLHNIGNILAATLAVASLGIDPATIWPTVQNFAPGGHRIEKFHSWRGIDFIDDSKATNVDAAVKAIETVGGPLIWLAGGVEKGSDYLPLFEPLAKSARLAVMVGPNTGRMAKELEGAAPIALAADWPEAVRIAVAGAKTGDKVLLAPACSSFDFFKSYSERGDTFQRLVLAETERSDRGDQ